MLSHVVLGIVSLSGEVETFKAGVGKVFLVLGPRDALGLKQINNSAHIRGDSEEIIVVDSKVVSSDNANVVWLGGVSKRPVVVQGDSLGSEPGKILLLKCLLIVGIFEPDLVVVIKETSGYLGRGVVVADSSGSGSLDLGKIGRDGGELGLVGVLVLCQDGSHQSCQSGKRKLHYCFTETMVSLQLVIYDAVRKILNRFELEECKSHSNRVVRTPC